MSEGTRSAQRINQSMTGDPYLLHRVDTSTLQTPIRMVAGHVEQRAFQAQPTRPNETPKAHGQEVTKK